MKNSRLPLLLLVPGTLWGLSFLSTEIVIETIPPITLGMGRSLLASIPLVAILYIIGGRLPRTWHEWWPYIFLGWFNNSFPVVIVSWGQLTISSGLTTILVSLNPLFTLVLAHFFISDERLNRRKTFGIVLGLLGVVVLVGPAALQGLGQEILAQLAVVVGAFSYAIASIFARRFLRQQTDNVWRSIIRLMASQYLTSTLTLIPFSLWIDNVIQLQPSLNSTLGLLALAWPLTLVPVLLYYYLIDQAGSSYAALTVYLIPLVGVFAGIVFLGEEITTGAIIALVFILGGIAIVNSLDLSLKDILTGDKRPETGDERLETRDAVKED
ncbi:MAG: DMT family transporter [Ardenticatenaceae bacterium]|nr:DMT family transporter [Ardenticatenaceae bacterium]